LRRKFSLLLGFLVLFPCFMLLVLRVVPPPFSAFMAERYITGMLEEKKGRGIRYQWVPLDSISPHAALAVVAAEDQKFPRHWGFDFQSIRLALEEGADDGQYRGASTISQQVAKNLFLWNGRSLVRKGLEAFLTVWVEILWPKKRILETYLNIAEFGEGTYGVQAAAKIFFKKQASQLSRREASLLAAVLPNPVKYRVQAPTTYVLKRSLWIQRQMRNLGDAYLRNVMQ
jgi:monofunctional biosynthetic peptidoglycan transglycosylase